MRFQYMKFAIVTAWVFAALAAGVAAGLRSPGALVVLAAIGLLPPLVLLRLWIDPPETMAESIRAGRR